MHLPYTSANNFNLWKGKYKSTYPDFDIYAVVGYSKGGAYKSHEFVEFIDCFYKRNSM